MENQQLSKLIDRIRPYKGEEINYPWPKNNNWQFMKNTTCLTEHEKFIVKNEQTNFAKVIKLREIIAEKYSGCYNNFKLDFWIVQEWGGIIKFDDDKNGKHRDNILNFKRRLDCNSLTKDLFKTIPSLSKISSFIEPNKYFIYDSRVVYSLNWLLLTTASELDNPRFFLFPINNSRNKSLNDYGMNVIMHLKYKDKTEDLFYNESESYFEYCKLIKSVSEQVYGKEYPLYVLEILLFTIADTILKEVKQSVQIKIE